MKTKTTAMALLFLLSMSMAASAMDVLKVQSLRSGEIIIDGAKASLDELKSRITQIKAKSGGVWFYREGAGKDATDQQWKAFNAVVDARVPISLSTKPDFSDYVDLNGQSHPR